jgi:hypothetical protein
VSCYAGDLFLSLCVSAVCLSPLENDFHGSLGPLIELGGNYTPSTLPHQAASGDDSPFPPWVGYLQLQNPLSGDITQCPLCLAHPTFVMRNSAMKAF